MALTGTIPMVGMSNDFVVAGLISNQAHPDRNLTGISTAGSPDVEGKMLTLLAEAVPRAKTVGYLNIGTGGQFLPVKQPYAESAKAAAAKLGLLFVPVVYAAGGGEAEFKKAFATMAEKKVELAVVGSDTAVSATAQQQLVARMALEAKLPSICPWNGFAINGGLMSYGGNLPDLARKAADYVALLLNGAKVADLPVVQPTVFDFVINQKTAKAIGVTVPPSLLLQATQVIESLPPPRLRFPARR
jgi:putative ABC transport system substrate-binding protein